MYEKHFNLTIHQPFFPLGQNHVERDLTGIFAAGNHIFLVSNYFILENVNS
jgi:hypothetical protein